MRDRLDDEQGMIAYLLGQLSEDEQARVEDRFLRDPEYLDRMKAFEQDLNDEYARGQMPARKRHLFETRIAASPEWRRRTVFAKALMTLNGQAGASAITQGPRRTSLLAAFAAYIRTPTPAVSFSLAAAFVIALGTCVWLMLETSRLRSQLANMAAGQEETRQRELEQRQNADDERIRSDNLARELEGERLLREQLELQRAKPLASAVLSLILTPGVTRGSPETVSLGIAPGAKEVRLQIYLEGAPDYHEYRAELRTAADKTLLVKDRLIARQSRLGNSVLFIVPASRFTPGEYEVVVSGTAGDGSSEQLGSYYFTVEKK